jgi:hypothetical protein
VGSGSFRIAEESRAVAAEADLTVSPAVPPALVCEEWLLTLGALAETIPVAPGMK